MHCSSRLGATAEPRIVLRKRRGSRKSREPSRGFTERSVNARIWGCEMSALARGCAWCHISKMTTSLPSGRGRPSSVTPEIEDQVLTLLSEGRSLREICEDPSLPDRSTIMRHARRNPQFAALYQEAKRQGCEWLFDDALESALSATPVTAAAERLRWQARIHYAATLHPKKYGQRLVNEHSGPDGGPIALTAVSAPMAPREVRAYVEDMLAAAEDAAQLPRGAGTDAERLQVILQSGEITPELYAAIHDAPDDPA